MTFEQIGQRIQDIRDNAGDDEKAHGMEDQLREDFIRFVASGEWSPEGLRLRAATILTTKDVDFRR